MDADTVEDAEPRWLDTEELDAWKRLSGVLIKLPYALDAQMQRDEGITYFEYLVMAQLSESPQRTRRMSALAFLTNGSLSRLSHVARRLEARGWLRREPCPGDGRFTNAVLTDEGYAKVVQAAPGHVATVRDLVVDALTPAQMRQVGVISERVLARFDPIGSCPPDIVGTREG